MKKAYDPFSGPAVYLPALRRPPIRLPVQAVFLLLFVAGGVLLANTAHRGGRLVHQFGVHALMSEPPPAIPAGDD